MSVADLTERLMRIDSVNPSLTRTTHPAAGECAAVAAVVDWAAAEGLGTEVLEATPGRPSVLVRASGTRAAHPGRTLLLCGHLDTVSVEGMAEPFAARREGDRLYGRGGYDMKAGVAAALVAARDAARLGLRGDVVVACVADEEHASLGIQEVLRAVTADAAIVTEPTELEVVVAHKGFVWAEIVVEGVAAHGSRPDLGRDAITATAPVLERIRSLDETLTTRPEHPLLGRGSVHAGTITGGVETSSYPARCVVTVERRTLPGEDAATFAAELEGLPATIGLVRDPFAIDPEHELVGLVRNAAGGAEVAGAAFWTDAAFIAAAGIPTVLDGPAGEGAHGANEWVSVASAERVAQTLVAVAADFCA